MGDIRADDTIAGESPSGAPAPPRRLRLIAAFVGCLALSATVGGAAAWLTATGDGGNSTPTPTTIAGEVEGDDTPPGTEPTSDLATGDEDAPSGDASGETEGTTEPEDDTAAEDVPEDAYDGPTIQFQPFGSDGLDADDGFDVREPTG